MLDTQTGAFTGAGDYNSTYASESVMKIFIATRLLLTGQMSGWNETTAYKMITQSDDASASALYGRTGGDGLITWIKQTLNVPNLGSPAAPTWLVGRHPITAAGMASFYHAVRHRPGVWNWLGNAMHHATTVRFRRRVPVLRHPQRHLRLRPSSRAGVLTTGPGSRPSTRPDWSTATGTRW